MLVPVLVLVLEGAGGEEEEEGEDVGGGGDEGGDGGGGEDNTGVAGAVQTIQVTAVSKRT